MKAILRFLEGLIDEIILNPAMTAAEAKDILQLVTNGISNAEATVWFDSLQSLYFSVGKINNSSWPSWRNNVVNDGAAPAKAMADAMKDVIAAAPLMANVNLALRSKNTEDELQAVKDDLATVRDHRNLQTDPAIISALNVGIDDLKTQRDNLQQQVDRNQ